MTRECTSDGMRLYLAMESVVAPVEECGPTASKDGASAAAVKAYNAAFNSNQEATDMWAQLIKVRVKSGKEGELEALFKQLQSLEAPGSGWVRSIAMQDQNNASQLYILVVFESEEKARARERDPRRQEALQPINAKMAEIFEGAPEFVDLEVMEEVAS